MIHTTANDSKYSYRTPLYQRLKALNVDIISFHRYSRGKDYVPDPEKDEQNKLEESPLQASPNTHASKMSVMNLPSMTPMDRNKKNYNFRTKTVVSSQIMNLFSNKQLKIESASPLRLTLQKRLSSNVVPTSTFAKKMSFISNSPSMMMSPTKQMGFDFEPFKIEKVPEYDPYELQSRLSTPVKSSEGNYRQKKNKQKEEKQKYINVDNVNPREHRRKVYTSIFNGVLADDKQIFLNPGYRGMHI